MKVNYYNPRKKVNKKLVFFWVLIMPAAVWSFFWIPYFKISEIEINNRLIRRSQVSSVLDVFLNKTNKFFVPKDNFFLFRTNDAQELILKNDLGIAEVNKKFPNKIELKFLEIKPKFIYCDYLDPQRLRSCFYVDKNGLLYELSPTFTENPIPLLEIDSKARVGDNILTPTETAFLSDFVLEIGKIGLDAEKIKSEKDFTIFLKQGWHIILLKNEIRSPQKITEKLKLILDQKIKDSPLEYIDMRFPNKAFYKLK